MKIFCSRVIATGFLFILSFNQSAYSQLKASTAAERLSGISKRKLLDERSLVSNVKFRNVGPTIMSGRVTDLEVNPADPTEFYVAYASGGLWHTTNNGLSFDPIFDHEDAITIGDIAVNWKNRSIWIGTGEVNSSRSSYAGTGMYLSEDSGKTWMHKGLPESHHIGKVLLHPSDDKTLWVAVLGHLFSANPERGVYKSTDKGSTWKLVLSSDDNTGAVDMDIDPGNPSILYAAMWHRQRRAWNFVEAGPGTGIYKSEDGGDNWKLVSGAGSGFPGGEGLGRIGLSVYRKDPRIIYAVLDNQNKRTEDEVKDTSRIDTKDLRNISKELFLKLDDKKLDAFLKEQDFPSKYSAQIVKSLVEDDSIKVSDIVEYLNDANNSLFETPVTGAEVYKSIDAGKTWKRTHDYYLKNLFYTYGYYFGKISVAAYDENKITVCGVPLLLSSDGGKTFKSIDGDNTHVDHHALWMNPERPGHMIIGNDGGVNITYDDGKSWFKANTPPVGQFYSVEVDMEKPYNVYGGLQDNGVWTGPSTYSGDKSWLQYGKYPYTGLMGGDGMQVQVDTRDNSTVYTGFQFGYYYRISKNDDRSSLSVKPKNDIGEKNYRFNWQSPVHLSRHCQDILYFGSNRFHRSMLKGEEMQTLSPDLTMNDKTGDVPYNTIVSITESPLRFGLIYAGTDDGLVWMSTDVGYSWTKVSDGLPKDLYVSKVSPSSHSEGRIYVSMNGYRHDHFDPYIFVSEDYGKNWKSISAGLPAEPVNVIREDLQNENLLFTGTDNGFYISLNRGKDWMSMNGDLPRVAVHDAVIHPRDNEIVLGTHGRSIFIAGLTELRLLTDSMLSKDLELFNVVAPDFNRNWGKAFSMFEEAGVPELTASYYSKSAAISTLNIYSGDGKILQSRKDTSEAGINYFKTILSLQEADAKSLMKKKIKVPYGIPVKAEDGNYYFPAGSYRLEIEQDGKKRELKFEIAAK